MALETLKFLGLATFRLAEDSPNPDLLLDREYLWVVAQRQKSVWNIRGDRTQEHIDLVGVLLV